MRHGFLGFARASPSRSLHKWGKAIFVITSKFSTDSFRAFIILQMTGPSTLFVYDEKFLGKKENPFSSLENYLQARYLGKFDLIVEFRRLSEGKENITVPKTSSKMHATRVHYNTSALVSRYKETETKH